MLVALYANLLRMKDADERFEDTAVCSSVYAAAVYVAAVMVEYTAMRQC
jgi:hypothetical protein